MCRVAAWLLLCRLPAKWLDLMTSGHQGQTFFLVLPTVLACVGSIDRCTHLNALWELASLMAQLRRAFSRGLPFRFIFMSMKTIL